jgi:hypothetical protein
MTIDRRTFVSGLVPFFSAMILPTCAMAAESTEPTKQLPPLSAAPAQLPPVSFRIHGWNVSDIDITSTESTSLNTDAPVSGDEFFISVSQSWRATWR